MHKEYGPHCLQSQLFALESFQGLGLLGSLPKLTELLRPVQLKLALAEILEEPGAVKPERCRFFRGQMQTIISRALTELEIKPVPSRRCFALMGVA